MALFRSGLDKYREIHGFPTGTRPLFGGGNHERAADHLLRGEMVRLDT